jgi:hypothetical protein
VVGRGGLSAEPARPGECASGTLCQCRETVYLDDRPLRRVEARQLVGPGRFWADYPGDRICIGDDPAGHLVEVARAPAAVAGRARDVEADRFVIEQFANPAQAGAVQADGDRWTIAHNEVRSNSGTGIHATGGRVLANHIHHNGQLGLLGTGDGQLVEGNEIDHNNTAGFSDLWEAGAPSSPAPTAWSSVATTSATRRPAAVDRHQQHPDHHRGRPGPVNPSHGIFHEISYEAVIPTTA